jgi:hypothetical protein
VKQPEITKVAYDNKLQRAKLQPMIVDNQAQFLETVDENKKFYTKRQFERAKQACELLYSLGYLSINDMKAIIWMNAIKNNPVTTEDVNIFGKDLWTRCRYLGRKDDSPCTNPRH